MATPNDSVIWVEGVHAFFAGRQRNSNPYLRSAATSRDSWGKGWDDACIISDPKNKSIGRP